MSRTYSFKDFVPLILIFSLIIGFTCIRQLLNGWHGYTAMQDFMGAFFIIFGGFKLLKLNDFAEAYGMYDLLAQRSTFYAYLYPFLEIGLGVACLGRFFPTATNLLTLCLMVLNSVGVVRELAHKREIACACLGTVFKIPMTYVTLFEDLLMATMAFLMLIW